MRISDWRSDVCSSELVVAPGRRRGFGGNQYPRLQALVGRFEARGGVHAVAERGILDTALAAEIADDRIADMQPDARHADRRHAFGHVDPERLARPEQRARSSEEHTSELPSPMR